ncbi:hypothetical protein [Streptomyces crystallinus]|uniref:Uncharacterized protein n=1 Tax=Streptomyces crystallinus TaxID=68191 RepID=A0ABN1F2P4_9ACTN
MTWGEWERIKAERASGHGGGTRLNQLAPAADGGGVGAPDMASTPAQKQAAAKAIGEHLGPDTATSGRHATESTAAAVKEFGAKDGHGWEASVALAKAHETWEKQVRGLLGRLAAEKHALSRTGVDFQQNDLGVAGQLARQSDIDTY